MWQGLHGVQAQGLRYGRGASAAALDDGGCSSPSIRVRVRTWLGLGSGVSIALGFSIGFGKEEEWLDQF